MGWIKQKNGNCLANACNQKKMSNSEYRMSMFKIAGFDK